MIAQGLQNNDASSLKVLETGCPSEPAPCLAKIYEHGSFDGKEVSLTTGDYDVTALQPMMTDGNDEISSLKVAGTNCCAVIYEHGWFDGYRAIFPPGNYDKSQMIN